MPELDILAVDNSVRCNSQWHAMHRAAAAARRPHSMPKGSHRTGPFLTIRRSGAVRTVEFVANALKRAAKCDDRRVLSDDGDRRYEQHLNPGGRQLPRAKRRHIFDTFA